MKIQASISDDDLCASCRNCQYRPGGYSECETQFKHTTTDSAGYVTECTFYQRRAPTSVEPRQRATPAQIDAARAAISDNDVQVDDDALIAPIEGSTAHWIQAWVYMDAEG